MLFIGTFYCLTRFLEDLCFLYYHCWLSLDESQSGRSLNCLQIAPSSGLLLGYLSILLSL
jgi:hypothetical protein